MLTGERRGVSGRRVMTVLGKIPAVPKPINLPSQRLENRGLDPNVEIVPRGSVSWGSAGRSPPTSTGAWGTVAPGSSPPVSNSTWGSKQGSSSTGSNSIGAGGAWGGAGTLPRPVSAGSGTRPSSAGSIRQGEQQPDTSTASSSSNPPWGPRPTSGPGVQVQTQVQSQPSFSRPRSADTLWAGPSLSGFGDPPAAALAPAPAWSGHATGGRLGQADEPHQASRFKLTRVDFPTLGSEKNPDLRPHPNSSAAEGLVSVDKKLVVAEERPPPTPPGPHDDQPHTPTGAYGSQERRIPDGWRRDVPPFGGHPAIPDGNWHRDGPPPPMPSYGGQGLPSDSWRREVPQSGSSLDDNWRRGGAPPIGQYGPSPRGPGGPSHFPHDGAGSMHQPRFGLGSGPYGPSRPGPSGFGRPGDMYPNGPSLRPGVPMRPNMFPGPGPYDSYYGHPGYANMEEQQRMMSGMGGPGPAGHGGFPFHHGPPFENFYPRGGMSQGPRQMPPHNFWDRNEGVGEGYNEGPSHGKGLKSEGVHIKDGRGDNEVFGERILPSQETEEIHPGGSRSITSSGGESFQQAPRPSSSGHHPNHRDWGAAVSSDEPMDFSKPVFEEEILPSSPRKQQSPDIGNIKVSASSDELPLSEGRTQAGGSEGNLSREGPKDVHENVVGSVSLAKGTEIVPELEHVGGNSGRDDFPEKPVQPFSKARNGMEKELTFPNNSAHTSVGKEVVHGGHDQSQHMAGNRPREVSASSASSGASSAPTAAGEPVTMAAPRVGQYHSSATTKPSILGNSPHSAVAADEKSVAATVLEKQSSLTSPPTPGVDSNGQISAVNMHILKGSEDVGQESPSRDKISVDMGALDISVPSMTTGTEAKDSFKPKLRISSHDGDKEWRPKVGLGDTSNQLSSSAALTQVSQSGPTAISAVAELSDTAACESEIVPTSEYDFEAQRAKMKEIAAQRARQLQKEEEERIREQKAKARAKLEELNRRTTVTQVVPSGEADVEPQKVSDDLEGVLPEPVVVVPEAGHALEACSSSGRQSGFNEQGKRERDRKPKENPKLSHGELWKRTYGSLSQPPPLLPSPNALVAPLLPSPTVEPQVQYPKSQQQSQPRSKGQQKQPVAKIEQADSATPVLTIDIPTFGDNGGWVIHTPPLQDNDSAAAAAVTGISEGPAGSRKKKSSRSSKNRQRMEVPASSVDITQVPEQSVNQIVDGSSGSDHPSDSAQAISWGSIAQPQDSGKDAFHVEESIFSLSPSDLSTGDGISGAANGDAFGRRQQCKPRGARPSVKVDRLSQDVRVTDRPHANDSMIWAPVRSPATTEEALDNCSSEQKEEISTQQRGRSKRAELERYTPKSVKQQQEALQQPSSPSQRAPILEIPLQPAPSVAATELQPVLVVKETKSLNESKQAESVTKPGRAHGSWRQRGSGHQDRRGESGKELLSAQHGSSPFQVEAAHYSQSSEQKKKVVQSPLGHTEPLSDHPIAMTEAVTSVLAAVQRPEKEPQAPVIPYQPPRPGSAPGHRGHGSWNAESKGHQERAAPHTHSSGTTLDRAPSTGTAGVQHHPRGGGGNHPRQQTQDREEQVYASSNVQVEKSMGSSSKPAMQPTLNHHEQQEQQQMRPAKHISMDGGEAGSQQGRYRQEQTARPFSNPRQSQQRGQAHWQQTGNQEVHHSQQHLTDRDEPVSSWQDAPMQAGDFLKFPTEGGQQNKTHNQPLQPTPTPLVGSKAEGGQWDGEHGMSPQLGQGRDHGRIRRGRFGGGRSSARPAEMDQRREQPIPRQRLVIDATGGAVPSQVGG